MKLEHSKQWDAACRSKEIRGAIISFKKAITLSSVWCTIFNTVSQCNLYSLSHVGRRAHFTILVINNDNSFCYWMKHMNIPLCHWFYVCCAAGVSHWFVMGCLTHHFTTSKMVLMLREVTQALKRDRWDGIKASGLSGSNSVVLTLSGWGVL